MTSPMGKAGESGKNGVRGELKTWLHTATPFPQWKLAEKKIEKPDTMAVQLSNCVHSGR